MSTVRWSSEIRDKHFETVGLEDVKRGTSGLVSLGGLLEVVVNFGDEQFKVG